MWVGGRAKPRKEFITRKALLGGIQKQKYHRNGSTVCESAAADATVIAIPDRVR